MLKLQFAFELFRPMSHDIYMLGRTGKNVVDFEMKTITVIVIYTQ